MILAFIGRYLSGNLTASRDRMEAAWLAPADALGLVTNVVMKWRLQLLMDFNGTITYRAYQVKPYQVVREKILSDSAE